MCGWIPIEEDEYMQPVCVVINCDNRATHATESIQGERWDGTALCTKHFIGLTDGEKLVDNVGDVV